MLTKWCVTGVVALSLLALEASAADEPIPDYQGRREAECRATQEARDLADKADELWAAYTQRYPARFRSREADTDFADVIQADTLVIERYPQSKQVAACRLHLAAAYQYRGDGDVAQRVLEEAATAARTPEEAARVADVLGLHHHQCCHDPATALPFFAAVPLPPPEPEGTEIDPYHEIRTLHLSAQLSMIQCELALKRFGEARARYDRLVKQSGAERYARETLQGLLREAEMTEAQFFAVEPAEIEPVVPFIPAATPKPGQSPEDPEQVREFLALMHRENQDRQGLEKVQQSVLAFAGDRNLLVGPLVRDFWDGASRNPYHWRAVWALAAIDTDLARQQLLKLALAETEARNMRPYCRDAALLLIRQLADKATAEPLLWAKDEDIARQGALALAGVELSDRAIGRIIEVIGAQHDLPIIISRLCRVLYQDPSGRLPDAKIAVAVESIPRIRSHPRADEPARTRTDTEAEWALWELTQSLAEMKDAREALAQFSARFGSDPATDAWRVGVLARALAGDTAVHGDVLAILRDDKAGRAREWTAIVLGRMGTASDIPLLEQTSKDDPLQCKRSGRAPSLNNKPLYPVRDAAARAIAEIGTRQATK
jgi:hypothetical protein